MLTTTELRNSWGPGCASAAELVTITLWSGVRVTVRRGTEDAWAAHDQVMHHWNYAPRAGVTGAYNCRPITGGIGLSLHAYGIALDTNWDTNPYGPVLKTDRPPGMVSDLALIQTVDGLTVFRWGGTYSGNKDAMHDEIVVTPSELSRGINWGTVAGHTPPSPVPGPEPVKPPIKEEPVLRLYRASSQTYLCNYYTMGRHHLGPIELDHYLKVVGLTIEDVDQLVVDEFTDA